MLRLFHMKIYITYSVVLSFWVSTASLCSGELGTGKPGSLWRSDTSKSMFSDKRARSVGDIVTILIQENNAATKENSTKTARNSATEASLNSFLFSPGASSFLSKAGQMPAMNFGSKNSFDGGGTVNNSEKLNARIAVRVIDVLPNGNLILEGKRQIAFANEKQDAVLRGTVRAEDVSANNTVYSYNIADASIQYISKGALSDSQRKGWFNRVWEKVSPF